MIIRSAEFIGSYVELKKCPKSNLPEYAFIGRSNVGKSSLINMLVNKKGLAKTSSTPGKTQTINFFVINKDWHLVDVPGIGYAKTSKTIRKTWQPMVSNFLNKRSNLVYTFYLVDSRLSPQKIDVAFMQYMAVKEIPFIIVFTKIDKLGTTKREEAISSYKNILLETWEELPPIIISSSAEQIGKEDILSLIEENNKAYNEFIQTNNIDQTNNEQ